MVINTFDSEGVIERALESVRWADEILICDMHSRDKTVEIAKKFKAKVVYHEQVSFVELARNFAISKASGEWILILDPDEEVPSGLAERLQEIVVGEEPDVTCVVIPRKNIIFGKWVKAANWWPDYNIRFFKKGKVTWENKIHRPPQVTGEKMTLPATEQLGIKHYHYSSISQFIRRMDRYTDVQAKELKESGYQFKWSDLVFKPLSEFLGRYFANRGFEDGLHGLALCLLQAVSFLVVYLKLWETEKFAEEDIRWPDIQEVSRKAGKEIVYWFKYANLSPNPLKRLAQRARNKFF